MSKKQSCHNEEKLKENDKTAAEKPDESKDEKTLDCDTEKPDLDMEKDNGTPSGTNEQDELSAVKSELCDQKEKYLRLLAEYENYKKRTAKETSSVYTYATAEAVKTLLPVLDNLRIAALAEGPYEDVKKGVMMILKNADDAFAKLGVEEIPALGECFNPEIHDAVQHICDDTKGEQEIIEEFQKGYRMGDKIIRHSMVKVAN